MLEYSFATIIPTAMVVVTAVIFFYLVGMSVLHR